MIKLVTFNVLCSDNKAGLTIADRAPLVKKTLDALDADVIGLQECSANSRKYSSIIEGLEKQGYREVPVTGCSGNLYTPVLYKADRLELVAGGYRLFTLNADTDGSKSLVWAVFRDRSTKETFAVISTHFTVYGSDTNPVELARVGNATELLEERVCPFSEDEVRRVQRKLIAAALKNTQCPTVLHADRLTERVSLPTCHRMND